jgi:radical SAM superfamily enzyme YgiQ (UPF0313 family)
MRSQPRILIIQPSHYRSRSNLSPYKTRKRALVGLTLPYLAALTPHGWEVQLVDEQMSSIDFEAEADVVAITTWTINSLRAYEIADRFRARGVPVIMGGPHTYFYPEESADHCDGVGVGEGETIFPVMLGDAIEGRLRKFYRAPRPGELAHLPFPRYDLLDLSKYGLIRTFSVQTSRGCPFRCEFCSERFYLGNDYRYRPVQDVINEIKSSLARNIFFADSNFAGKPDHTMELMEAFIPLRIRWSTLWPAYLCNNARFMDLAKRSGLLHVNLGIESVDQQTLRELGKKNSMVSQYQSVLRNLREREISYSLNFIFGWDTEPADIFSSTLRFLREEKVPAAYFNILTPHKGTPLYERMLAEDRIIHIDDIGRWPGIHCHIKPKNLTAEELEENVRMLYRKFYNYASMFTRLPLPLNQARIASWMINLSQRKVSRAQVDMESFDDY